MTNDAKMHRIPHDLDALAALREKVEYERDARYLRLTNRWAILTKQHQELEQIIELAFLSSRYYCKIALEQDLQSCRGLDAFQRLPLLSRPLYAASLKDIRIAARHLCYRDHTSGTSGRPIEVLRDSRSVFLESRRFADILRYYLGDIAWLGSGQVAVLYVSHYSTSNEHVYEDPVLNGARIVKLRCDRDNVFSRATSRGLGPQAGAYVLTGTVSSLLHLASSDGLSLGLPAPAALLVSGESVHTSAVRLLEAKFGAPVFELYTLRECGTVAFQCRYGRGLHFQADWFVLEILDPKGRVVADGDNGELVITDLTNYHVPLLRYATGDFGCVQWAQCVCGLALPLLSGLSGRAPVRFAAADGRLVDTGTFAKYLDSLPVAWYRVTQFADGAVKVEYCAPVRDLLKEIAEFCQILEDALELSSPVSIDSVTVAQAVQHGKTGGFISKQAFTITCKEPCTP